MNFDSPMEIKREFKRMNTPKNRITQISTHSSGYEVATVRVFDPNRADFDSVIGINLIPVDVLKDTKQGRQLLEDYEG